MAVPFSNTKLRVPKGFQNILECLAREVLRSQPDNIHEFAAAYFEKLLKVRSETGHDPAVHGASLEDRNYNNESFKKRDVDPSDPQQNDAATKIQTQYRQHSAKAEVNEMKEEVAATRIQAGFRGFLDREQVRDMKTKSEDGNAEEEEEVDIDLGDPEVEKAAIKIQAGFKGFKARKEVQEKSSQQEAERAAQQEESDQKKAEVTEPPEEEVDIDLTDPEVEKAAVKIQAGFKGFKARQGMSKEPEAATEPEASQSKEAAGEEEVDIDLEDPATEKAALKIQAGFRGYQTRKDLSSQQDAAPATEESQPATEEQPPQQEAEAKVEESQADTVAAPEEEIDIDLNDPEVEKAATKIQAGFKGLKTRKQVKQMKDEKSAEGQSGEDQVDAVPVNVQQESTDGVTAGEEDLAKADGEAPAADAPAEEAPAEQAPAEEAPAEQAPAEEAPAEQAPAEEAPAEQAPAEEAPAEGEAEDKKGDEEIDIDLNDPDVEKAAVKIQAGFKGMKTRREVKASKDNGEGESKEGEAEVVESEAKVEEDGAGQADEGLQEEEKKEEDKVEQAAAVEQEVKEGEEEEKKEDAKDAQVVEDQVAEGEGNTEES